MARRSSEYTSWAGMRGRCNNPKVKCYPYYGGRGITVCDRWSSFENFLEDMGSKPTPHHTLDRINSDGIYEPSNCRWATRYEQRINQRPNRCVTYRGAQMTLMDAIRVAI